MKVNITTNFATVVDIDNVEQGQKFAVWAYGTWGGGTLGIGADVGDGSTTGFFQSFTADTTPPVELIHAADDGKVGYNFLGGTGHDIWLNVVPVRNPPER